MTPRSTGHAPTVVVARNAAHGREREFERWLRRLVAAARQAPGHVEAEVQAPDELHPGEWVVVYQFATPDHLEAWLGSPVREAIVADGRELVDGDGRVQVLALAPEVEPVTAVSSVRVSPERQSEYRAAHDEVVARLRSFDGFLRAELFEPVPGVQEDTVVVLAFTTREALDRWLDSDERRDALARLEPLVDGARTVNVVGGFAGWFGSTGSTASVRTWKQALVVLAALFPTALVLTLVRQALLPDLGLVLSVLLGNIAGVAILSWLLMPPLTRWLDPWLRR